MCDRSPAAARVFRPLRACLVTLLVATIAAACASTLPERHSGASPDETRTPPGPDAGADAGRPRPPSEFAAWDQAAPDARLRAVREAASRLSGWTFVRMANFACGDERHETALLLHDRTKLEFVLVPAGFAPDGRETSWARRDDGRPSAFLVARTEVTRGVWRRATDPAAAPLDDDDRPVTHVSWREASDFCAAHGFSLPTESQWVLACRAGAHTRFCFGDDADALADYAWTAENSGGEPGAVATRAPNALGVFDMHGNVREWCRDLCRRGGSCRRALGQDFDGDPWSDRASRRGESRSPYIGFRPVAEIQAPPQGMSTAAAITPTVR
jgi:formylglycine-generating enzyme required for sulfatase activity